MSDFQQRVETALYNIFDESEGQEIKQIAEQADQLRTALDDRNDEALDLTVDFIMGKMEERADNGPRWAWNNWAGSAAAFGIIPTGYQID